MVRAFAKAEPDPSRHPRLSKTLSIALLRAVGAFVTCTVAGVSCLVPAVVAIATLSIVSLLVGIVSPCDDGHADSRHEIRASRPLIAHAIGDAGLPAAPWRRAATRLLQGMAVLLALVTPPHPARAQTLSGRAVVIAADAISSDIRNWPAHCLR